MLYSNEPAMSREGQSRQALPDILHCSYSVLLYCTASVLELYIVCCATRRGVVYDCHITGKNFGEVCVCSVVLCCVIHAFYMLTCVV